MSAHLAGRTGYTDLPLHNGRAPTWLFRRMTALSRAIIETMAREYSRSVVVRRLSDPFWFQALSCVLGFDWHSSGTTTVTCHALKDALEGADLGIAMAGGKGKHSLRTPAELGLLRDRFHLSGEIGAMLERASRLTAKVDNTLVQDGFTIYHHSMMVTEEGEWAVIQQGMDERSGYARRYHWSGTGARDLIEEPHTGICGPASPQVLDLTASASRGTRECILDLVNDGGLDRELKMLLRYSKAAARAGLGTGGVGSQSTLADWGVRAPGDAPGHVSVTMDTSRAFRMPRRIDWGAMTRLYDVSPDNFEELVSVRGIGASTLRAISLVSELVHGTRPSWKDPVRYSFAVGGKDGVPYPVDRRAYDRTIEVLEQGIREAKLGKREISDALVRLGKQGNATKST